MHKPLDMNRDLLVALAGHEQPGRDPSNQFYWWGRAELVGVFVQERSHPAQNVELAMLPSGSSEIALVRIQRATNAELVIARTPESGRALDNIEVLFDAPHPRVIRQIRYAPFAIRRMIERSGAPYFIATDFHDFLVIRPDARTDRLEIVKGSEERSILARLSFSPSTSGGREYTDVAPEPFHPVRFGPEGQYALAEAPGDTFSRRRFVVKNRQGKTKRFPLAENIGPFQVAEKRLWFGKTFYDAEGMAGMGGFGYFDTEAGKYALYSPPEVRRWSVSAILIERDAIWLALVHRGEYGDNSGGVLRWDRGSGKVTRFAMPAVTSVITRYRNKLYFATSDGIAALAGSRLRNFFVDYGLDGTRRVVEETTQ